MNNDYSTGESLFVRKSLTKIIQQDNDLECINKSNTEVLTDTKTNRFGMV